MTFVRGIWSILVGIKDALVLIFMLLFFVTLWSLSSMWTSARTIPSGGGALDIDLSGTVVDEASDISPLAVLSGSPVIQQTEIRSLVRAIDVARTDTSIKAIALNLDGFMGGGQANLDALGEALDRFRAAGKPVEAFATAYADSGYFVASHASHIWMSPEGAVLISGPGGSSLYFKEALDKLNVNVEVFRVGKFKSFVEPYTRTDRSPEAREADQQLVDDVWKLYRTNVEAHRKGLQLDTLLATMPERLRDAGKPAAELAVDWGLVDRLGGRIAFSQAMHKLVGDGDKPERLDDYAAVDLDDYLAAHPEKTRGSAVGVIHIAGSIVDGESPAGDAAADSIAELVEKAVADPDVKAIVVRIDSPGGSVTASERIREALVAAKADGMPIVASFGPVAASGGYWVATAADAIYARPSTITGSIGVFGVIPTFEGTLKKFGVHSDFVGATPFSGQPDIVGGLNAPFRTFVQAQIGDTYQRFLGLVGEARKLPASTVETIAEGRVWSGERARDLKLIDGYGDLDTAVKDAARRAGLKDAEPRTKVIRRDRPWFMRFFTPSSAGGSGDAIGRIAALSQASAMSQVQAAVSVAQGSGIQARCFACAPYTPAAPTEKSLRDVVRRVMD